MFAVMSSASTAADLVDGLGERWQIFDNGVKPYACGVVIHPAIDAVLRLREQHGVRPADVESIALRVHPLVVELADHAVDAALETGGGVRIRWADAARSRIAETASPAISG